MAPLSPKRRNGRVPETPECPDSPRLLKKALFGAGAGCAFGGRALGALFALGYGTSATFEVQAKSRGAEGHGLDRQGAGVEGEAGGVDGVGLRPARTRGVLVEEVLETFTLRGCRAGLGR